MKSQDILSRTHVQNLTVSGMTCGGCESKIQQLFENLPGVLSATADRQTAQVTLVTERHITEAEIETLLQPYPKYTLGGTGTEMPNETPPAEPEQWQEAKTSFWATYKPLLLVFAFITGVSVLTAFENSNFRWMAAMQYFMAGFFLVFSFFKLLNLKDFAASYAMYDLLAARLKAYGYVYPFLELALGIAYLTGFQLFYTNIFALMLMGFSSLGVIKSLLDKRKIRCACLGAVFNLPMSTVTLVEDLLMVAMAAVMLLV